MTDYCTVAQVKAALNIAVDDTREDDRIELAIAATTQAIDDYCDRSLIAAGTATAVRVFVPDSDRVCTVDDIGSVTSLVVKTDGAGDGTWDTTWASTDYQLEPVVNRRGQQSLPYTRIRAIGDHLFPILPSRNYPGQATVQVTARWGWPEQPPIVAKVAVLQAVRMYKRDQAPFGVTGFGDMGAMRITRSLDPDVQAHLDPFKRIEGYA